MQCSLGFGGGFSLYIKLILAHSLKGKVWYDKKKNISTSPSAALQQWARLQMRDVGVRH